MSFYQIAEPYALRGVPVVPVQEKSKACTLPGWQNLATTDLKQIRLWHDENPNFNVGVVAKDDGILILDCDQKGMLKRIEQETGHKLPETLIVRSGTGYAHVYFKQTSSSRKLGNRNAVNPEGGELFSLRQNNRYVVGANSVHPNGNIYRIYQDAEIVPFPEWLVPWIEKYSEADKPRPDKGQSAVSDDFDFDDFCDHYGIETFGDGPWYYTRICPVKGDKHEHSKLTGFYFDGSSLGFHCFAAGCGNPSIGDVIRVLNESHEPYRGPIWPSEITFDNPKWDIEDCTEEPEESQEIASAEESNPDSPPVSHEELAAILGAASSEQSAPLEAPQESPQPPGIKAKTDLKYPELRFPYEAIPEGRMKELTDKACEGGLSPGLVVPALLGLTSSLPYQDRMDGNRINLFVCLLALVGAGKDMAMKRALSVMGLEDEEGRLYVRHTPSGERAIAVLMGDKPGTKADPARRPGYARLAIITPELEETLRKSKAETSGVLQALQFFYDYNRRSYVDSRHGTELEVNCRLSWITALPVGNQEIDADAFKLAFGENTAHGLASRMIFGFSETAIDPRRSRNWEHKLTRYDEEEFVEVDGLGPVPVQKRETLLSQIQKSKVEGFEPGVEELYLNWNPGKDLSGRDLLHIHKIAINTALLNGNRLITAADWQFAETFMRWQHQIRTVFSTGRAKKVTQGEFNEVVMEETIKRVKRFIASGAKSSKHMKAVETESGAVYFVRWKAMSNDLRWYKYGMDVEKTIDQLVRGAALSYLEEMDEKDDSKVTPNKAWVRVVNLNRMAAD